MEKIIKAKAKLQLNSIQKEHYEERAGIMEYDGKLDKATAETMALILTLHSKQCLQCKHKNIVNICISCKQWKQ